MKTYKEFRTTLADELIEQYNIETTEEIYNVSYREFVSNGGGSFDDFTKYAADELYERIQRRKRPMTEYINQVKRLLTRLTRLEGDAKMDVLGELFSIMIQYQLYGSR